MLSGKMPWQPQQFSEFKEQYVHVGKLKRALTPEEICVGRAKFFVPLLANSYNLKFAEKPDYNWFKKIFYDTFDNYQGNKVMDWQPK